MVDMKSCSISGPPSRLRQLKSNVKLFEKAFDQIPPVTGLWNAFHVYGKDQLSEVLETRLSALDKLAAPCRAILSPSTGELIQPLSSRLLFTRAVDDLLEGGYCARLSSRLWPNIFRVNRLPPIR